MEIYRNRLSLPPKQTRLHDKVVYADTKIVLTRWTPINPRLDFACGCSCYYLDTNYKIGKFFDKGGSFLFYYCDMVRYEISPGKLTYYDLLLDIHVYPDMTTYKVLDIDELVECYQNGGISLDDMMAALLTMDTILSHIHNKTFGDIVKPLDDCGIDEQSGRP